MESHEHADEELTLEDLPNYIDCWLQAQCGGSNNGGQEYDDHLQEYEALGLESLGDHHQSHYANYDHVYTAKSGGHSTLISSSYTSSPGRADDMMGVDIYQLHEELPLDDEFLNDLGSPSLNLSGDLEGSLEVGGDTDQLAPNYCFDSLPAITCLSDKETQSPLPLLKVVRSTSPKKRVRPHSAKKSNSSNKKKKISSPMSVLDYNLEQAHSIDGSSLNFSACLLQQNQQGILEPLPKTSSPQKNSKKASTSHSTSTHPLKESKWAQQLLKACASAIATNNVIRTQHLMWVLNDLASFTGDANQRLAACGLKALFSRVSGVGISSSPSLQHTQESDSNGAIALSHHRALLKFQDASPWHKCAYTIANGAIVEACEGHDKIHVVDIGISQGTQWPTFIEALATRASGVPKLLKLTMVHNGTSCENFVSRLEPFAKRLGINLKLKSIATPLESLTHGDLGLEEGEELIICLQFRLHLLTQEVDQRDNLSCGNYSRDNFLKFIHNLNPRTLILSENDVDHCSLDFLTRFQKAMEFHWNFLDSTNSSFQGQDTEERQIMEAKAAFAFTNVVAFEGTSRIERNETHRAWSSRAQGVGFSSYLPGAQVLESAKSLLRKHSGDWNMLVEDGTMVLRWKGNPTTFCSIWKPFPSSIM